MSNQIAKISKAELALTETEELFSVSPYADGNQEAYNLIPTQLRVASGGGKSFVDDNDESINAPLVGVVLRATIQRVLWLVESERIPFCSSAHGHRGKLRSGITQPSDIPDKEFKVATGFSNPHPAIPLLTDNEHLPEDYACAGCPMNDWGSDPKNGRGKACTEKRGLLFLPDGWLEPAILAVPTMSIKNWDSYASSLRSRHRVPYYAVRTEIDVSKTENKEGQSYGQLNFKMVEKFEDADMAREIIAAQKEYGYLLDREQAIVDEGHAVEGDYTAETDDAELDPF